MARTPFAHIFVLLSFLVNTFGPVPFVQAQEFMLPAPGAMVRLSPPVEPAMLKGIKVHANDPFSFEFILDLGNDDASLHGGASAYSVQQDAKRLIKYFLAGLTIPEKDLWVNLSPYEKDRIIPQGFGLTEMGRDLLAEDYMLKQITASLIYPEGNTGKKFWKRIYEEAARHYGTTDIPVNTFNKVWIVPEKAVVFENAKAGTAYVVTSRLKVMLEQDYLSLAKHEGIQSPAQNTSQLGNRIVREIVLPELTREVNENKSFSTLRQAYNSLILAAWYKSKIKNSILEQVYADQNKTAGIGYSSSLIQPKPGETAGNDVEAIYQRYLRAFKKGVYNYIKEDVDPMTREEIPRKYFSGGMDLRSLNSNNAMTSLDAKKVFSVTEDKAQIGDAYFKTGKRLFNVSIAVTMATAVLLTPFKGSAANKKHGTSSRQPTEPSAGALNILQYLKKLTPLQIEQATRTALQSVADNTKASGHGAISLKTMMRSLHIPGKDLDAQLMAYSSATLIAFENSPDLLEHFKSSSNPLGDFEKEIAALIQIESSWNGEAISLRPDGNTDQGALQTHGFDHPFSYYQDKPLELIREAIEKHWNETMRVAEIRADQLIQIYGPSYLDYFGINKPTLQFLLARALWNGGNGLSLEVLARVPIAVFVPEGRVTFMTTKVSYAYVLTGDYRLTKIINTTTPNLKGWGHAKERLAFLDEIKGMLKELGDISSLPLPAAQREARVNVQKQKIARTIKDFQIKMTREGLASNADFNKFLNSDLKITIINEYSAAQPVKANALAQSKDAAMSTPVNGGIDLNPAHMNLLTQNAGEAIKFRADPALLQQWQNAPGFVPVIINIKPVTDLRTFLGLSPPASLS